jgi:hypothetical protein
MCELYEQLHTNGAEDKLIYIKTHSQIFKQCCVWHLWMYVQDMVVLKSLQLDTINLDNLLVQTQQSHISKIKN